MFLPTYLLALLTLLPCLVSQVAGNPLSARLLPIVSNITSVSQLSIPTHNSPLLSPPVLAGDWEYFLYRIPDSRLLLKGRILTGQPINRDALHAMIVGGISTTTAQLSTFGDVNLREEDNPYKTSVLGCSFRMFSNLTDKRAKMTYAMMRQMSMALEKLLDKSQRSFETVFVLADHSGHSWGHGEVVGQAVMRPPATS